VPGHRKGGRLSWNRELKNEKLACVFFLHESLYPYELYKLNKGKVFVIILGQCTLTVKNKLKSLGTNYKQLQSEVDMLGLLTAIRNVALANAEIQNPYWGGSTSIQTIGYSDPAEQ
jgi:hypothetical protein